ncbi:hypothetical protein EUX98_g5559 [Antrodiella citrinella]|uniref:non-specific serine/threonine protein kinase n=1 Tax=Antrodiella citrinella TaxID=2447956 RepID=A0A4S4MRF4_9APHY|nr:hypothetical protein EUX98_g5559 [Antrodiella citrinella]
MVEKMISEEPVRIDGDFEFEGTRYPILRSQPILPLVSWNVSPHDAEIMVTVFLSDLGSALWANQPNPPNDMGAFALRAPENIIRAECGKEIDIWAVGCMTYELLAGEILFRPQPIAGLTPDESLLLLRYALTGETLDKTLVQQSRVKDQYFDREGNFVKAKANPYPHQTIQQRLANRSDLSAKQIEKAAAFIQSCLRLNPADRLNNSGGAYLHDWIDDAFMVCADPNNYPGPDHTHTH